MYGVYARPAPSIVGEVVEVSSTELDRMLEAGVSDKELERAKGHMKGGVVLALEDPFSRMTRLGKSEVVGIEILSLEQILASIDAVTAEEVARVAADLLPRDRRILSVIGPFQAQDFDSWPEIG